MLYVLVVLETIFGVGLLFLIFLHSGKGSGLSAAFGGSDTFGGSSVVQKNLDRLTVGCAVAFFVATIALVFVL